MINELVALLNLISQVKLTQADLNAAKHLIDLTNLEQDSQWADIHRLCDKANKHQVAAICVYPKHITQACQLFNTVATVVNFPTGSQSPKEVLQAIDDAVTLGAKEIDCVFDYPNYLSGNKQQALSDLKSFYVRCQEKNIKFKVILETGKFESIEQIYQVSIDVIEAGCDFIKTSTGKIDIGASLEAAFAMLAAIRDAKSNTGIKLSGGIKTSFQAIQYMTLTQQVLELDQLTPDRFRIGASSLLDDIVDSLVDDY